MVWVGRRKPTVAATCRSMLGRGEAIAAGQQGMDGPLWPCHVGFAGGIGKPQKTFRQGRDVIKFGFIGRILGAVNQMTGRCGGQGPAAEKTRSRRMDAGASEEEERWDGCVTEAGVGVRGGK